MEKTTRDKYVYVEINQGVYGIPQAGLIAQQLLEKRLNKKDYHQSEITPGLWKHTWRPICFSLCVNDFGVKYVGKHHAENFMLVLRESHKISHDWKGKKYLGVDIYWGYSHRKVHLSMLVYVTDALTRFRHNNLRKLQHQPYPKIKSNYGAKAQYAEAVYVPPPLSISDKTFVQEFTGGFLYYAQAFDPTILTVLGSIAAQQANPTEHMMKKVKRLLDYAVTHPDAILAYHASEMVLAVHSNAL